jgi:RNA-directed DNA polymerase
MKTSGNLFESIIAFDNVLDSAKKAARGKREQMPVLLFFDHLEDHLWQIISDLRNKTWQPGPYTTFSIYSPKPRMISAAPFRDRVVHHALIAVVGPLLERSFIFDTWANRTGKGTHKAIRKYQEYLRRFRFVMKCDIKKFFPSIDHLILESMLRQKISCPETLWLIDAIIDNSNVQEEHVHYFPGDDLFTPFERRRGLPIGNLTSQYFANYYLNFLDHFVKEVLQCKGYLRYVDDFVLFSDSKAALWEWKKAIGEYLQNFRLVLNSRRTELFPATEGKCFLGQRVFRSHRLLPSANVRKAKRRILATRRMSNNERMQRLSGWLGHARQADTFRLLCSLWLAESGQISTRKTKKK